MHIRVLHLLVLDSVYFVADNDQYHIGRPVGLELLDPGLHDLEGPTATDIIDT